MLTYDKPHLTFEEQLNLLKKRGLKITDEVSALNYLRRVGYYRLSAYWYPLRQCSSSSDHTVASGKSIKSDHFIEGSCFKHAVELYIFDKKLRFLLLDAILMRLNALKLPYVLQLLIFLVKKIIITAFYIEFENEKTPGRARGYLLLH